MGKTLVWSLGPLKSMQHGPPWPTIPSSDYPTDYLLPSAYEDGHRETIRRCHTFAFNGIRTKGGPRASLLPKSQETSATQKKLGKLVSEKCCHQRERAAFTTPTCHQGKRIRDWISPKEWYCVGLLHNRTRLAAADGLPCPETIMGAHGAASNHREQKNQFIFVYTSNEYIFLLTSTQIQILVQNCAQRDRQLEKWGLVPNAVPHTIMGAHGAASNHRERTLSLRKQTNIAILIW